MPNQRIEYFVDRSMTTYYKFNYSYESNATLILLIFNENINSTKDKEMPRDGCNFVYQKNFTVTNVNPRATIALKQCTKT